MADARRLVRRRRLIVVAALLCQKNHQQRLQLITGLFDQQCSLIAGMFSLMMKERREFVPRIRDYCENVVPRYNFHDFQRHFRLTKSSFEIILRIINEYQELPQPGGGHGGRDVIEMEKQLLIFLWYLGNNETFRSISDRFGVSESTVHCVWRRLAAAISSHLLKRFVVWPSTPENIQETEEDFFHLSRLTKVIGCIDGSHIRIKSPHKHPDSYINRKKFHSVVLQGVCNSNLLFTDVYVGWPGSTHDARVFRNSPICRHPGTRFTNENYMLGDKGYPIMPFLITPFRDYGNLSREQVKFNKELSKARQTIERTFGLLKGRFRKLRDFQADDMHLIVNGIVSACVMHNICRMNDDDLDEEYYEGNDVNEDMIMPYNNDAAGVQVRQRLVALVNN